MSHAIYHDLPIQSDSGKVFDAITNPRHLVNWWPYKCSGSPEVGATYNFNFTDEYDWYGKVIDVHKNKSFHIQMTKSDADWDPTQFGFELENHMSGVLVRFSHIGWQSCNAHFRRTSYCWAILLQGLKHYVERGDIIPFEERS